MSRDRLARLLFAAFALAAAADLASLLAGADVGHTVCKPLLMPLLAGYTVVRGGPRLLVAALLFGWGGDVLLLLDADVAFLAGMASFAVGHVCYLVLFARHGTSRARSGLLGAAYGLALIGTVALLWSDLPSELRVPVAGYSLLLTAMAFRSTRLGLAAGLGGALFLLSDTLIATGVAEWPQLPTPDFWIMLTYLAAQALLAKGVLAAAARAGAGPKTADVTTRSVSAPR
ncbi:lysoplasmalogenase [Streptomyces sp. E11-3]|uniref:lysoplasmalogenase n=1 Tax=Streptomyces sp. E11-3 TaxID=3110112 RepID=UPI00397F9802